MNVKIPELLAPAGSPEGVRAAVQSGAGAVYMGFGTFNARRNAQGFSHEEMADAIAYCRARNVKSNITLNILVGDRELDDALEDAKFLYEAGADALIVQDLGLARLIHAHAPDFALHASTQMTIHTLDGARQARDIGFSRVVLSRECTREQIEQITREAGVETEVFVHGALCMCYSGQCYLSAVIGQRSGNRGLCAQPCRLPYNGGYPLSLKDLMLAGHVAELADWGVSSLKIEGRMKRPEYAAIVTKVYADLLREHRKPTAGERDILRRVFSRDGFTDGYYTGKKGDSMFGTKTDVPMSEVKSLYDEAARRFAEGKEAPLVPVNLFFSARRDTGAGLSAGEVTVTGGTEQAKNRPTTPEMVEKSLSKTGGTPFYVKNMHIEVEDGLVVPASVMNGMRRDALALLLSKRSVAPSRDWMDGNVLPRDEEAASREGFGGESARGSRTGGCLCAARGCRAHRSSGRTAARLFRQRAGTDRNAARRGDEPRHEHRARRQHRPHPARKAARLCRARRFRPERLQQQDAVCARGNGRFAPDAVVRGASCADPRHERTARDRPYRLRPSAAHDLRKLRHPPSARRKMLV